MDLLAKSDEDIFAIGKPFWENLVRSSNLKDYGGFTRDFSTQMLFGANEVELGKQWANNELITNLKETYEPFGTLRRGEHITILIKQTNKKIPGEFLGRLFGIDANIGGIGIAMLLLIFLSDYLKNAFKLGDITEKGITFWSMIYIPIVVAMASKQNVLGALDGGLIALLSGGIAVLLSFLLIPVLSKIKK